MLLAVDIGNTNVTFGVFDGEKLCVTWRIATNIDQMPDEYASFLLNLLHHQGLKTSDIKEVALCCVVPPLLHTFEELSKRYFHVSPLVVGPGIKTGVRIHADNPREVGTDRIVNTAAAHHLYTGPVIVVDLGTGTTFDIVSREGDFVGGVIAPGIAIAAQALYTRAAALPRVELVHPQKAIGTNTITAMQSGIVFGYTGLVEGLLVRIQQELGEKALVVATGGYAELIARGTKVIDEVNPDITLVGLRLIYLMNKV
ncbi:MAG: type III pantothenate kinase [Chloroflexi bacterium]|nr:type III pantothenate kinase [Chloroflexota bacterium]